MNIYALIAGILIGAYVVVRFRQTRLERKSWAYPLFLATFPIYYWVFAIYAADYSALTKELLVGSLFIILAFVTYRTRSRVSLLLLATAYIGHSIYNEYGVTRT